MLNLKKSTVLVTLINTLGMGLSFISTMVTARQFGAGADMDAYFAAITLPSFLIVVITGPISVVMIPLITQCKVTSRAELSTFISSVINIILLLCAGFCIIGMIGSKELMQLLAPGFSPELIKKSAFLLQLYFPLLILSALTETYSTLYYSNNYFVFPTLFKVFSPVTTILFVIVLGNSLSTTALVTASVTTYLFQTLFLIFGIRKRFSFNYTFTLDFGNPYVKRFWRILYPVIGSLLISKTIPLFERWLGSLLPVGCISILGYAQKFPTMICNILATGIITTYYPLMAASALKDSKKDLLKNISIISNTFLLIIMPIAVYLCFFGMPIIQFLFERGKFSHHDTILTFNTFIFYILCLPFMLVGGCFGRAFYVIQDTKTISIIGICETLFYFALCYLLIKPLGIYAMPIAYLIFPIISIFIMIFILSKRIKENVFEIFYPVTIQIAASVSLGLIVPTLLIKNTHFYLLNSLFQMFTSFLVYFLFTNYIFKISESKSMINFIVNLIKQGRFAENRKLLKV